MSRRRESMLVGYGLGSTLALGDLPSVDDHAANVSVPQQVVADSFEMDPGTVGVNQPALARSAEPGILVLGA